MFFLYQQKAVGFTETSVTEISESSEVTQRHGPSVCFCGCHSGSRVTKHDVKRPDLAYVLCLYAQACKLLDHFASARHRLSSLE